jgi:hypothetical protein
MSALARSHCSGVIVDGLSRQQRRSGEAQRRVRRQTGAPQVRGSPSNVQICRVSARRNTSMSFGATRAIYAPVDKLLNYRIIDDLWKMMSRDLCIFNHYCQNHACKMRHIEWAQTLRSGKGT